MKTISIYNPRRYPLTTQELFSEFDDLFTNIASANRHSTQEAAPGNLASSFEVHETEKAFLLSLDLPGIRAEDIDIQAKNRRVSVTFERKKEIFRGSEKIEKSYGKITRTFQIPEGINEDLIEAHCENGVLTLAMPKTEKTAVKSIQVKSGSTSSFMDQIFPKKEKQTEPEKVN